MEGMRCEMQDVCDMLDANSNGVSPYRIAESLSRRGLNRHPASIYRTLDRFTRILYGFTVRIPISRVGDRTRADEIQEYIGGHRRYIFGATDARTRFLSAQDISDRKEGADLIRMLQQGIDRTGKMPTELVTDVLGSFRVAFNVLMAQKNALDDHCVHIADPDAATARPRTEDGPDADAGRKCIHINNAGISKHDKENSNGQERFNSTQRGYYTPRRGIKTVDSYLFYLFVVWYNHTRTHSAIGCTPAEASGIRTHGMDVWQTLIENACVEAGRGA